MTPARLRNWILLFATLLVVAIASFFFHARWVGRRLNRDVPSELAKTIQQATEGFTHSESRGGHTIYTLHASKAVQFKSDGHAELHDVSITLYNAQGAPANRIYGRAFDWDPVHGIARALGEVMIDLEGDAGSPRPSANSSAGPKPGNGEAEQGESRNTVHVKTSGLVFDKQTGLTTTTERLEFRFSAAAGSAMGASFNSQTGLMVLMSEVAFNSSVGGSPFSVRAHHAQFDRQSHLLYLLDEVTDFQDSHSSADQATVAFRADGSAYQVEAEGNVVLTGSGGQKINTRRAQVDLDAKSAPQQVKVDGGLLYVANREGRQMHGSAASGTMLLGPELSLRHAQLRDAVSLVDVQTYPAAPTHPAKASNRPESSSRQVQATQIDVDFATGPDRSPEAKEIQAVGSARLNVHTIYSNTPPRDTTVQGDQLLADLVDGEVLSRLRGTGHTSLVDLSTTGSRQSSTGDSLLLTFTPSKELNREPSEKKTAAAGPEGVAQLKSAEQQGHVTLTQQTARDAAQPKIRAVANSAVTTAFADRVVYDGASQVARLSGSPRVRDASGELSAALISMEHLTGDATATGGVKATYTQSNGQPNLALSGSGPVHVLADHAHLDHATGLTTFYGEPPIAARLWQASNSVAAPVLELSQSQATLSAHAAGNQPSAVTAVFSSGPDNSRPSTVRVQSRTLSYTDSGRKATFAGGVVALTATGTLRADAMDIYLVPSTPTAHPASQPGSSVERIVARGAVNLLQTGRKASGEELTYTAADGQFKLMGTSGKPPHLSDQVRGTVTGTSLIFNDRDDSVIVSGGSSRTVTETRVAK